MIKKTLFLSILTFILMLGLVNAANTVNLMSPATSAIVNSPVTFTFNITGDSSSYSCVLYTDENGTWVEKETNSGVANSTATSFSARTIGEITSASYKWNVLCDATDWAAANYTFGVDDTDPSITVNTPSDESWDTDGLINITITVSDDNPNTCILTSTMNTTDNATQVSTAYSAQSYTNATAFSFTGFDGIATLMADENTGAYTWSVVCTDDAGNSDSVSTRTLYVDTTDPTAFVFNTSLWQTDNVQLWENTTASDYTPQIGWQATTELNFDRYRIRFYKDTLGNETFVEKNISTRTTLYTAMSTLVSDTVYHILITAYDLAGNSKDMTVQNYKYSTTSTGHSLPDGWVSIMNSGNARNLSDYLGFSSATTVSYFNKTHEFTSHVSGGSNGAISVPSGEAVFLYMGSDTTFSDSVWNTSAMTSSYLLRNESNSDWNVACNRNGSQSTVTLQRLDNSLNTAVAGAPQSNTNSNVTYMSYVDWTTPVNVPFKANWSINNDTSVKFGECAWMYLGAEAGLNQTIDWNNLG